MYTIAAVPAKMSSLSTLEARLPPGFRFHPRDEELICDYLLKWVTGCASQSPFLIQVDLNKCEPWDIPEVARVGGKEWYFYSLRDRKYATGVRTNRATVSGYWKATGKDRPVFQGGSLVGMRKTLVFYQGRAPRGTKTNWVMHEFRLKDTLGRPCRRHIASPDMKDWVLCRVFYKKITDLAAIQETGNGYEETTTYRSPFMETMFDQTKDHRYGHHEQVPCFSILAPNQQSPTLSLVTIADPSGPQRLPTRPLIPRLGGMIPDLGTHNINTSDNYNPASSCDQKAMTAALNRFTNTASPSDYDYCRSGINGSPCFGEGVQTDASLKWGCIPLGTTACDL